jgi:glutamyl-tRNA reductase
MQFLVFGLSHKTAPIQLRERFSIVEDGLASMAEKARDAGLRESFVVSTCNRVEFYGAAETLDGVVDSLRALLADIGETQVRNLEPHLYEHRDAEAVRHLFRVAASLDSMVVGEPQILGQLKLAYGRCRSAGVTGPALNRAVERAFATAKRVRSETGIGEHVVSISSVAIQLAKQIFGDLQQKSAALIGAGKMGELAARHLVDAGIRELFVANRRVERAQALATALGGHPRSLDELPRLLSQVDIVVTSTAANQHLVGTSMMKKVMKERKYRPIFFIDIAVPRNVDPKLNQMDNVYVYDVDDLNGISSENRAARQSEALVAEALVAEQADRFLRELAGQTAKPTILEIRQRAQESKALELQRARRRLTLEPENADAVMSQLADKLVNKMIHGALVELKRQASDGHTQNAVETIRRIYDLDDRSE